MSRELRACRRNCCALDDPRWREDAELAEIDAMQDALGPLDAPTRHIRRLITAHESCHHKAARHVDLIISAIATGHSDKGPGRRADGPRLATEQVWRQCCDVLLAWAEGKDITGRSIGDITAAEIADLLGAREPLKAWQVRRVAERARRYLDSATMWQDTSVLDPAEAKDDAAFLAQTEQLIIHDTADGQPAELRLSHAIDHLRPCNWNYLNSLRIVLGAIGGNLHPTQPFAQCGRNITLTPIREQMRSVSAARRVFWRGGVVDDSTDSSVLATLGEPTPVKRWLAASLDKTLRMQLRL